MGHCDVVFGAEIAIILPLLGLDGTQGEAGGREHVPEMY